MRKIALIISGFFAAGAALAQDATQDATLAPAAIVADASVQAPADAQDPSEEQGQDATGAGGQLLASRRDYLDPKERDAPIVCKQGDLERHAGQSLGQVFGADWPTHPAPAASATRAKTVTPGKLVWPRGMEGKTGLVVVAVLVGADGKPLRAEPLCATTTGFDMAARRRAMDGTYEAAQVDGKPVVSPVVRITAFLPPRRKGSPRRRGASDD